MGFNSSPEDIYIKKLKDTTVANIIDGLIKFNIITKDEYDTLYMWCIDGETHAEIAEKLGVNQSTITRRIKSIQEKCQEHILNKHQSTQELFDSIYVKAITTIPKAKQKDIGYAKHKIAYPSEYLCKISITGKWYKEKYILRNRCVIPEFFHECFGDDETKCTLCYDNFGNSTCSRTKDN